jgi:phosphoribosylformylglycinamidine synthase
MGSVLATTIDILSLKDDELQELSKRNLLALSVEEMKAIQEYYRKIGRNPTDVELETIAQTWSEHCKHKTLRGIIEYYEKTDGKSRKKVIDDLLKTTIFRVTKELKKDWCISVFRDNAGIIKFNENYGVAFKVETHNHPSAVEPYGGAGTGIGGVIRDILGVGLGAKPICNTDVFCFAPPEYDYDKLPKGTLHPKRILKGVVAGVRDYGNRMGIPTVNGTIIFDKEYLCNPLVYCGTVGIIPKGKYFKKVSPGDVIISVGGRTGRDGIHGATFSSLALDKDTPLSPVQIGNPIVEKKVVDTVLQARDKNLYSAITDCGAGGFSSAIGELGMECGARVHLERAPLKYEGLKPWEIWLSEAQERMVLAVPRKKLKKILKIFEKEDVEVCVLGEFTNTGKLEVFYKNERVCDIDMEFLHHGLPRSMKKALWEEKKVDIRVEDEYINKQQDYNATLAALLAQLNICSKEWVIRQYDHEVQGQTVIKPFVGKNCGPSDGCLLWPISSIPENKLEKEDKYKGIAIACGINPQYGKIDPYHMACLCIDEAVRNVICIGGDFSKTALLDNFCWGSPTNPYQLGGIVRAAFGCYDTAKAYSLPFISGKDSLNNDFYNENGELISIPGTLLISAVSIVKDIRYAPTADFKSPGNFIYLIGEIRDELGGSEYLNLYSTVGVSVPKVTPKSAKQIFTQLSKCIQQGLILSCHDCSQGGLAVAISEMSFSSDGVGCEIELSRVKYRSIYGRRKNDTILLFSESPTCFLVEVSPEKKDKFEKLFSGLPVSLLGKTKGNDRVVIKGIQGAIIIDERNEVLLEHWREKGLSKFL